jgi:lactosylceramide 4-alpha-galactosyltransferase
MTREQCTGFAVLQPNVLYEISYAYWRLLFEESLSNETLKMVEGSYGEHVWNRMSSQEKISVGSKTAYGLLAQKHCPRVYWNCGPEF